VYHVNNGRTDGGTDGRPENIASTGAYQRQRLKNSTSTIYSVHVPEIITMDSNHGLTVNRKVAQINVIMVLHNTIQ